MKPILKLNSIRVTFFQRASLTDRFTEPNQTTNQIIMKTIFLTASRHADRGNRLMRKLKLGFWTACLAGMMTMPAFGGIWTGAQSANWSDPANWDPVGVPQNYTSLYFGYGSDSHRSMVNDLTGLVHISMYFMNNDYQIDGNTLTVAGIFNDEGFINSDNITINCPLVFLTGGDIYTGGVRGAFSESTDNIYLNGPIDIGTNHVYLVAESVVGPFPSGGDGHLYVAGVISGSGDIGAFAQDAGGFPCSIEFIGGPGNNFTGTLYIGTSGNGQLNFNKSSGVVVSNRLGGNRGDVAKLQLSGAQQIGNYATIYIADGSQLSLSGNDVTVGSLVLTNKHSDALPSTLDTGSTTVSLNVGINSSVNSDTVHPIIKGKIDLNGLLPFNVTGGSQTGLEMPATIAGVGFDKTGNNVLYLTGNNTFSGNLQIDAGRVTPSSAAALSPTSAGVILNGGILQIQGLAIGNEPLYGNSTNSTLVAYDQCSWSGPVTLSATLNVLAADTTASGKAMTFTGPISGAGGMTLENPVLASGTVMLGGGAPNTFTGPLTVYCPLVEFNKPNLVNACSGPIIVGGGSGALCEARWLHNYQDQFNALTLYANGYVNLINHDENFGPVTFNGGTVDTGSVGQFAIYAPLTVNPSSSTATINGRLGLPPGNNAVLNVGAGSTPSGLDLVVNAVVIGAAPYFGKQGAGTMSLTAANIFTGVTLLEAGIIAMGNGSALSSQGVVIFGGATLRMDVNGTMNQGMELYGTGVGGTHGALELSPGVNFSINGDCLLDAATTLNVGSGGTLQLGGAFSGSGPLTKIGTGLLVLYGISPNTYSGDTLINQGTLSPGKNGNGAKAVPGNLVIGTRTSPFSNSGTTATVTDAAYYCIGGPNVTVNGGSLWDLGGYHEQIVSVNLVNGGSIHTSGGVLG